MSLKDTIPYYSQHGEDSLLWEYFDCKKKGYYVEVGAFDGRYLSNTYFFEQQGWTGICIEPHPVFFAMCEQNRPGSVCVNMACVGDDRNAVVLQTDPTGLFSGLADDPGRKEYVHQILKNKHLKFDTFRQISVEAATLDSIIEKHHPSPVHIDFVSIDVEGTEIDVLEGFDLKRYSPELIVIEANSESFQRHITQYLGRQGYFFARKTGVNMLFVSSNEGCRKMKDIILHCEIEKQVHPFGLQYSVKEIADGLKINEFHDEVRKSEVRMQELEHQLQLQSEQAVNYLSDQATLTEEKKRLKERVIRLEKDNLDMRKNLLNKQHSLETRLAELSLKHKRVLSDPFVRGWLKIKRIITKEGSRKVDYAAVPAKNVDPLCDNYGPHPGKLIVNVQYGLGNRLRALASAQLLARRTCREFVLLWLPDVHCQAKFSELFANNFNVIDSLEQVDFTRCDVYNYMDSEEGAEKNKFINHQTARDIYVKSAFVLNHEFSRAEDINGLLQELVPVEEVLDIVNRYDVRDRVGMHIRRGGGKDASEEPWDNAGNWSEEGKKNLFYWREKSSPQVFMKEVDRLLTENPALTFFLAADSDDIYIQFEDKYPDKIVYLKRELYDRSADQQKYALADILLLSRSKYILGSYWSSFSEIAQRIGGNTMKYSGKDF